jgi:hypothetical protein
MAGITSLRPTHPRASGLPVSSYKNQPTPTFTICRAIINKSLATMKNLNAGYILKKEVPNIETVKLQ